MQPLKFLLKEVAMTADRRHMSWGVALERAGIWACAGGIVGLFTALFGFAPLLAALAGLGLITD